MKRFTLSLAVFLASVALTVGCSDDPLTGPTMPVDGVESDPSEMPVNAADVFPGGIEQLLVNGDLESTLGDEWWKGRTDGYALEVTTLHSVSATHSLSISSETAHGDNHFTFWAQTVRVDGLADLEFTLNAAIKLEQVTGEGIAIAIRGDDTDVPKGPAEAFATTQGWPTLDGTADWTNVDVELRGVPSDVKSITVYLIYLPHTTGIVYFDDVNLSAGEAIPVLSLQNGDVEDGSYRPDYWWNGGYPGFDWEWTSEYSVSPSHSLKISRGGADESSFGFWAQTFLATDYFQATLTLRGSIRLDGAVGEGVAIAIRGDDTYVPSGRAEAFATTQGKVLIAGSQEWTEYSVTLENVPSSIKSITIYLIQLPYTQGTVYFDDISLEAS
jgi:hypothetical protein